MKTTFLLTLLFTVPASHAAEITFTIEPAVNRVSKGLGPAWNSKSRPLRIHVGDTLVIANADSEPHILHTRNGHPFPHPDSEHPIAPNASQSFLIEKSYDAFREGPLYDHEKGPGSGQFFWIVAD